MEVDKDIVASLKKAAQILHEKFELEQKRKRWEAQELIDEFNLNYLHEELNEGKVPSEL